MSGDRMGGEDPAIIKMDCRAFAVLGDTVIYLFFCLREVDVDTDLFICSEFCTPAEAFR